MKSVFYKKTARLWGVVFLLVGLLFLIAPEKAAEGLTSLGHLFSLRGVIRMPRDDIGYVLALSLMSIVTWLAYASSRDPYYTLPYRALLVGKAVSTAAFAWLAWREAPIWALCAVADGFVALTLWGSHQWLAHPSSVIPAYQRKFHGQSPFYEVWFGKIDISAGRAFWFRYSLLNGARREAAVWGLLFDGKQIHTGKAIFSLQDVQNSRADVFRLHQNYLDVSHAAGQAGPLQWTLDWQDSGRQFSHGPTLLKKLALTRSRYESCFLDVRFSGSVRFLTGKEPIDFVLQDAPGMIGHIWGSRHARSWAWVHCNHFPEAPDLVFEGLSARLSDTGARARPFSSFVLYLDGHAYDFSSLHIAFSTRSSFGDGKWAFSFSKGPIQCSGEARLPDDVALVEYTDTDGARLFCHNSKMAFLKLHFVDRKRGIDRVLETHTTAAFEIVDRTTPHEQVTL